MRKLKFGAAGLLAMMAAPAFAETTVLTNATVIDGTGRPAAPGSGIVMTDGKISWVGPMAQLKAPKGASTVDLTAHVDFSALAQTARNAGAAVHGPLPQGLFLQRLGLATRSAMLAASGPAHRTAMLSAAQRLMAPEAMGRLFKALCLCHPNLPTPPGFEAA